VPEIEAAPAVHQRAVWLLAADGYLGADCRELVVLRAGECLAALGEEDRDAAVSAWQKAIKPDRSAGAELGPELGPATDLIRALDACERVAVLRQWVAEGLAEPDLKPADEVDPIVPDTLRLLVDEGSPAELPLLVRERELRKVIGSAGAQGGPDDWESPVEPLVELLRTDVAHDGHPGRRALATRICAPHILAAAERLATQARDRLGDEAQIRTSLGTVTVTAAGPVQSSLDKAVSRRVFAARHDAVPRRRIGYTSAGVALALALLALVAGWGWLVPALGAVAVAGWQFRCDRVERATAVAYEASTREKLRAEAEEGAARYAAACAELNRRRARLDEDLAALRAKARFEVR
jgi:hypothetical protein